MSRSDPIHRSDDFNPWLSREFAGSGAFTTLVILVQITDTRITPLCSTYFNVIGDDVEWNDIVGMFYGSGRQWDGAAFFPAVAIDGGPLDNPTARLRLRDLESRVNDDRLVLNEGHFFDKWGRRMNVEEVAP